jgi:hypothetical protein
LFFDQSYSVTDGAGGIPLGQLVPSGAGWTMIDTARQREVYVLRDKSGVAFARYTASADGRELCRFTWTIEASVVSTELEIEFMREADATVRSLAVALAPILELRARLRSEPQSS